LERRNARERRLSLKIALLFTVSIYFLEILFTLWHSLFTLDLRFDFYFRQGVNPRRTIIRYTNAVENYSIWAQE